MDRLTFNKHLAERLDELKKLLSSKGDEYANVADVHHNFKEATGLSIHNKQEKVLWEYCVKHLQSIRDIVSGKQVDYSTIKEKTGDVIAYMLILESMYAPVQDYRTSRLRDLADRLKDNTNTTNENLKFTYWDENSNK